MYELQEEGSSDPLERAEEVKKTLQVALEDREIIELLRILQDNDAEATLVFLKTHFKGKARELLEGG
jgi:hypothetical protein